MVSMASLVMIVIGSLASVFPFFVLLTMWSRIGINMDKFKLSIWSVGFHVGLAAIFGLYSMYWWKLSMFQTLGYLLPIALPTLGCLDKF
uniref:Dolichyl-diphosphooligosaccharide--protein glycosyltransferase subunit 2 n=1 Tax=Ditylenchus dipsaci TaxID=166011 RepID=A0A915D0Y1_9BILA